VVSQVLLQPMTQFCLWHTNKRHAAVQQAHCPKVRHRCCPAR
jgi:hypothetical protein